MNTLQRCSRKLVYVLSAFCMLIAIGTASQQAMADGDVMARWQQILDKQEQARRDITSLQFSYELHYRHGTAEKPDMLHTNQASYARQGSKYAFDDAVEIMMSQQRVDSLNAFIKKKNKGASGGGVLSQSKFRLLNVYNGDYVYNITETDADNGRHVDRSRQESFKRLGALLPDEAIAITSISELEKLLEDPKYQMTAITTETIDGRALEKVTISRTNGSIYSETWYDLQQGGYPIHAKNYTSDGTLVSVLRDVKIASATVNDVTVFYPAAGVVESFDPETGISNNLRSTVVNTDTLRLNQPLPDETFVLKLRPGDTVYDNDLQIEVVDPNPTLELTTDVIEPLSDAQTVASSSTGDSSLKTVLPDKPTSVAAATTPSHASENPTVFGQIVILVFGCFLLLTIAVLFIRKRQLK